MKTRTLIGLSAGLAAVSIQAQDLNPPTWRTNGFNFNKTSQEWTFSTSSLAPVADTHSYTRSDPTASITGGAWQAAVDSRPGVWALGSGAALDLNIVDYASEARRRPEKLVWVQLGWQGTQGSQGPVITANGVGNPAIIEDNPLSGGGPWHHTTYQFLIGGNPSTELIHFVNNGPGQLLVDGVVVDTLQVPEPGAWVFLAAGAAGLLACRPCSKRQAR